MSEMILALVPTYGLPVLFIIGLLAAIGAPLPSTLVVMAVGAFVASGDLGLVSAFLTAFSSAFIGDQIGYQLGLRAGNRFETRLTKTAKGAKRVATTKHLVSKWGGLTVFLTRWLLAPIGPTTNIICGASDMRWSTFTKSDLLGEAVWASIYIWIGYTFHGDIIEMATLLGGTSWLIIAAIVTVLLGMHILTLVKRHKTDGSQV